MLPVGWTGEQGMNTRGVTLIELLVAMMIIGVLVTIAYPGYQHCMHQSRRGEAINQLLALQLRQEAYRVEQGQYSVSLSDLGPASDEHYRYALQESAAGYQLTAEAKANSPQREDSGCQRLTLDGDEQRWPASCWP